MQFSKRSIRYARRKMIIIITRIRTRLDGIRYKVTQYENKSNMTIVTPLPPLSSLQSKQVSHTRTSSLPQPLSGTFRRFDEHSLQNPCPQPRQ